MQPSTTDRGIRREVLATLKVNPAASLDTVLGTGAITGTAALR